MRILTLGVLVVAGGTLAALPFRRYQTVPDASSALGYVTGPSQSVLHDRGGDSPIAIDRIPPAPVSDLPTFVDPKANSPATNPPGSRPPRPLDIPLTFADLAVPLRQPDSFKERFNATQGVHRERSEKTLAIPLVMPSIDALRPAQLEQIHEAVSRFSLPPQLPNRHVTGALAGSSSPTIRVNSNVPASEPDRDRHWIRQPH